MQLKVISTGSNGNCLLIENNKKYVMLDCGAPFKSVLKAVDFKVNDIDFCFAGHKHFDHISAIYEVNKAFIPIYSSIEMQEEFRFCYVCPIGTFMPKQIGEWVFRSFDLSHDEHNIGLLMQNTDNQQVIAYISDTGYIKSNLVGVNILICECNYIESMIQTEELQDRYRRIHSTHLSLERLLSYLSKIDKSVMHKIILVHLSDRNSDEVAMVSAVQEFTGIQTYAAHNGEVINLDFQPF
jgi:phosphoribosyl 1,2-cyclic phosphodiesterase